MQEKSQVFHFGLFELNLQTAELRKRGIRMKLQRQPFEVLALLVARNGAPVTREELQERLWPGDTFVDFEHAIGSAIYKIRTALGDAAVNPRFVETLSNRSYRFIAPIRSASSSIGATSKMRLAVLPFANIGGDTEQDYFADGVTNELIWRLGRMNPQRLGVIARTSAMAYRGTTKPLSEIARELNVEYVLEGSIQQDGNRVRIMTQLVRLPDQTPMWTETYDHVRKKILDTQIKVAERIAEALTLELLPQQWDLVRRSLPQHSEAYDLYLRGRHQWNKRSELSIREAVTYFQRAIARDPKYAMAYTGLADVYAALGYYGLMNGKEAFSAAKRASTQALELDDGIAEAHSTLAFSTLQYDWDWEVAAKRHRLAVEINSNCAAAYHWYGIDLTQVGLFKESIAMLQRAQSIDPLAVPIVAHIGRSQYFSRDNTRAVETLKKATELDPEYAPAYFFLGMALLDSGCKLDAVTTLEAGAKLSGNHPALVSALAHTLYRSGKKSQAERVAKSLAEADGQRMVSPYFQAFAIAGAPKLRNEMFRLLERAYEDRFGWLMYMKFDPAFDHLRDNPKFIALLGKIKPI